MPQAWHDRGVLFHGLACAPEKEADAANASELRMLRSRLAGELAGRAHLQFRMYVLPAVRRRQVARKMSELRRTVAGAARTRRILAR